MSEWISIDDRLPAKHEVVALLHNDRWMNSPAHEPKGLNWHGVGSLDDAHSFRPYWDIIGVAEAQCIDAVTHWMPLPTPPNE
jgi:hypothetical protein